MIFFIMDESITIRRDERQTNDEHNLILNEASV